MIDLDKATWFAVILGLTETIITYFCIGFTTIALTTYVADAAVDLKGALLVGSALALFQIVRFIIDIFRDVRKDARE